MATVGPAGLAPPTGLKYLGLVLPALAELRDVGCGRDHAGNRTLHFDDYCKLGLLFLFNPALRSLRALQQASTLAKVRDKLGVPRTSLGSLSESVAIFEPARLEGVIADLLARAPRTQAVGAGHIPHVLTAVDGSVVKTLSSLVQAAYLKDKNGGTHCGFRFHTHFEIDRSVPVRMEVTSALNSGKSEEKQNLRDRLEADRCYVMDRWYAEFELWNDIVAASSSYVCRIRDNSNLSQVVEERPVGAAARPAGVISDKLVRLGTGKQRPNHVVRVVQVQTTPHKKTGGRKGGTAGPPSDGIIRIATNLLDVPAEVIAETYRNRWAIELFFRFWKHLLGGRHLLCHDPSGIQIHAYLAIVACLLMVLWTGGKPSQRTYEMLCHCFAGLAGAEELAAHLAKLEEVKAKRLGAE